MATFPKARRLLRRIDFARVQRRGSSARCAFGVVILHVRDDSEPARLGIVASRKVGGAVARNRAKRLVREWFRHATIHVGLDVVVLASDAAAASTASELAGALDEALVRARARLRRDGRPRSTPRAKLGATPPT
jgi:ribonuclease P protein component